MVAATPVDDGPEEFQVLNYCYFCCRRLNQADQPSTKEVAPQTCADCGAEQKD